MSLLTLRSGDDFFEMGIAIEEDQSLPAQGDAYVTIKVQSRGFTGHNDLWVQSEAMQSFCSALVSLERNLKGEASLEVISPGELSLKVCSVNSRGGVGVAGTTGYLVQSENTEYLHAVSFGFEFEPSQLSAAIQLPWVKRYAG